MFKKLAHYAVVLGLICAAAAFGVAGTYRMTKGRIEEKLAAERAAAQRSAVNVQDAGDLAFNVLNPDADKKDRVVEVRNGAGDVLGYVASGEAQGYGGLVTATIGMDKSAQRIIGSKVLAPKETPGLGSRVSEVKSDKTWWALLTGAESEGEKETTSEFLKQFRGRGLDEVQLGSGSIQAITGATISSTAVVEAARKAVVKIQSAAR